MLNTTRKIAALIALAVLTQTACYNNYFISKTELKKLESTAEPQEVVEVYGDCAVGDETASVTQPAYWAQADVPESPEAAPEAAAAPAEAAPPVEEGTTATDAAAEAPAGPDAAASATTNTGGCTLVKVSAGNALFIVDSNDEKQRVTPFNFIMSQGQLVSPEYDLLENLDNVKGAEVSEFSTWKTVGTIVGVSTVAVGTFIAIAVLAPDASGFQ